MFENDENYYASLMDEAAGGPVCETNFGEAHTGHMHSSSTKYDIYDFENDCSEVMLNNGLMPPNQFISDGKLHRCGTVDKPHGTDGAYILHEGQSTGSAPTLWWQNHKTGASDTFSKRPQSSASYTDMNSNSCAVTTAEQRRAKREFEQQRREFEQTQRESEQARREAEQAKRETEQAESYANAALKARDIWDTAYGVDSHPYLTKKGVAASNVRMTEDGRLVLPVYAVNSDDADKGTVLQSLQFIDKDGTKRFLTGGKKAGGFLPINAREDSENEVLCLCEGYATGMSINMATGHYCLVAFDAGNLMAVGMALREKCPDWPIIVCADNDVKSGENAEAGVENAENPNISAEAPNVGVTKALDVALAIGALVAIPPAHGGKATDFNDLHQARGLDAVADCIAKARPVAEYAHLMQTASRANHTNPTNRDQGLVRLVRLDGLGVGSACSLRKKVDPQAPYPVEALGDYADAAVAIAEYAGAPLSMVGNTILSMLSLAAQDIAIIEHEGRKTLPSLYLLSILGSGERKSSVNDAVMEAIDAHQEAMSMEYDEKIKAWRIDDHAYQSAKSRASKGKDYATIRNQLQELGDAPVRPVEPRLKITNTNIEGLYKMFQDGSDSLGLIADEGGILFGGTAFSSENKLKTIATLSSLWSSGSSDKVRMGEGSSYVRNKRLTCHLMVQPIVIEPLFADRVMQEQGFLPRFLVTWPESLKGTRLKTLGKTQNIGRHPSVRQMHKDCLKLLQFPRAVDEYGKRRYIDLPLSHEAEVIYVELYNKTELAQGPDGELCEVANFASRTAEQALRIAGVLSLAKDPRAENIDGETMRRAAELSTWYTYEAKRIMENSGVSPEILRAERMLSWLAKKEITLTTAGIVQQNLRFASTKEAEKALELLAEHGFVKALPKGTVVDGKPRTSAWLVLQYATE